MYSSVALPKQWSRLGLLCRSLASIEGQKLPQTSAPSDGISPPARIPRGPTDILQALATTVGPDPTAAHYKYHDDPYLIPLSNYRKRAYALAAEAGRKAAVWIRDEHPELFNMRVWDPPMKMKTPFVNADPPIEAFSPKSIYNDDSKVTEEDLKYTINNVLLEDSIKVFQLLGGADAVNDELKLAFLQLLCFYNGKEPDSMEWLQERWFASNSSQDIQAATWKLGGLADKIFTSMEPKTPEAYCAVIQGMAKFYQAHRAHMLAQEARENGIPLSTEVYNSLITCVGFLKDGVSLRTEALKSLLMEMKQQGLAPNVETLSSCLKSISVWGAGNILQKLGLQIVAEFKKLGIEPGLSAYYYLLCLFCKENGPRVDILTGILQDLESRKVLEPREPNDTNFFLTAMGVCSDHLQSVELAERLHALLMKGDNYKLVGDAFKESIYYRHYFTVNCRHAPFEKSMQLLDTIVPNIYVPEPSVMHEIIKTLELGGAGERLAQCWSQLVIFGHAKLERVVARLLQAMVHCYRFQDEEIKAKMRASATEIIKYGQMSEELAQSRDMRSPVVHRISASALLNIIELCSDTEDKSDPSWETVSEALSRLKKDEVTGFPSNPDPLVNVAKKAATIGLPGISAMAISYLADCGFDEALTASVQTLGVILNRPEEEVKALLQKPRSELTSLHPTALAIAETYQIVKTGGVVYHTDLPSSSSSSPDSDSDSDSSDEER